MSLSSQPTKRAPFRPVVENTTLRIVGRILPCVSSTSIFVAARGPAIAVADGDPDFFGGNAVGEPKGAGEGDQKTVAADALFGIEPGGWLVDDEQLRIIQQRLGDA